MRTVMRCLAAFLSQLLLLNAASAQGGQGQTTATGLSRAFNPAISANGLFLGTYLSGEEEGEVPATGLHFQEMEVQLTSFVDAYLKADLILALPGGEGIEVEEGVVTTQGLPYNLALKAGKFYADLGRHHTLHAHAFPFIDAPLVLERLLGEEGLNETGLGLSALLPLPWYAELNGQVLNGDHELFASPKGRDLLYVGHLKNFWDLGPTATLELGGSWAGGENQDRALSSLAGADLTLKWRAAGPRRRALVWQSEYLRARREGPEGTRAEGGVYSLLQYQFARRWWAQARWDLFGLPKAKGTAREHRVSGLLALVPSEFSALRLQCSRLDSGGQAENQALLQFNFSIGSHPAHRY
jgi:hypothetical protein